LCIGTGVHRTKVTNGEVGVISRKGGLADGICCADNMTIATKKADRGLQ